MGTRGPHPLVDTTPAKTILVYRNGDQFYVGRKFVLSRRRVANFEALLEQLTEQVAVPFGVRRLYTPTRGHQVLELDALQAGGKYVAAGRERFKKLDYIHIVPRKPSKIRKLKEIKPVVHCDINVPSRWQTYHRVSRHINVFTNGRLFDPPIKIIIPKFSLSDWNSVLATIGEKVFPLGGVRKLFTLNGHLLDNSKDLQDNSFYVAAGLETFKHLPYWRSHRVPKETQQMFADTEKHLQRKKKVDSKGKEPPPPNDSVPSKAQDSVYYAKEGKKKTVIETLVQSGAEGDVYKAQTPTKDAQDALDVREEPDVKVEMPVDQVPAEIVNEDDEVRGNVLDVEGNQEKEDEKLYEDMDRKGGSVRVSFKKKFPLRHNTKRKEKRFIRWMPQILKYEGGVATLPDEQYLWAPDRHLATRKEPTWPHKTTAWCKGERTPSLHPRDLVVALDLLSRGSARSAPSQGPHVCIALLKNLSKNKKVVPSPEEEQHDIIEEKTPPVLLEREAQREPPVGQQAQEEPSPRREEQRPEQPEPPEHLHSEQPLHEEIPEQRESPGRSPLEAPSQEQRPQQWESLRQSPLEPPSQEQRPEQRESPGQLPLEPLSQEQRPEQQECPGQSPLEALSQEERPEQQESPGQSPLEPPSEEQRREQQESPGQSLLEPPSEEQRPEQRESPGQLPLEPLSKEQRTKQQESPGQLPLEPLSQEQRPEQRESPGRLPLEPPSQEQRSEQWESPRWSPLEPPSQEQRPEERESPGQLPLEPLSQEQRPEQRESQGWLPLEPPSQEQRPEQQESPQWSPLEPPSQEQRPEERESPGRLPLEPPSQEQKPEERESPGQLPLEPLSEEQRAKQQESPGQLPLEPLSQEQRPEERESPGRLPLEPPSQEQRAEQRESPGLPPLELQS